ncbi:hypothetical protein, partial [Pseudobacillus badius]
HLQLLAVSNNWGAVHAAGGFYLQQYPKGGIIGIIKKKGEHMQIYSLSSVLFTLIGAVFAGLSFLLTDFVEYLFAVSLLFMLGGVLAGYKAILYKEAGKMKFVGIALFFLILFVIVLAAPFHIVRMLIWIRNWPIIEEFILRMTEAE